MSLRKVKHPVEYSFLQWMNNHPDSAHWADKERFFRFVKTVARFRAKKWKSRDYLKNRILTKKPGFDHDLLEWHLDLYLQLLEFHNVRPVTSDFTISEADVRAGHYVEVRVKKGAIIEVEVPLRSTEQPPPPDWRHT